MNPLEIRFSIDDLKSISADSFSLNLFCTALSHYIFKEIHQKFIDNPDEWQQISRSAAFAEITDEFLLVEAIKNSKDAGAGRLDICIHINADGVLCALTDDGEGIQSRKLKTLLKEKDPNEPWLDYKKDVLGGHRYSSPKGGGKNILGGAGKGLEQVADALALSNGTLHITNNENLKALQLGHLTMSPEQGATVIISSPLFDKKQFLNTVNHLAHTNIGSDSYEDQLGKFILRNGIVYTPGSNDLMRSSAKYLQHLVRIEKREKDDEKMDEFNAQCKSLLKDIGDKVSTRVSDNPRALRIPRGGASIEAPDTLELKSELADTPDIMDIGDLGSGDENEGVKLNPLPTLFKAFKRRPVKLKKLNIPGADADKSASDSESNKGMKGKKPATPG